jgi:type IV secretory pathway TraG/TraD family ATPase VirD4
MTTNQPARRMNHPPGAPGGGAVRYDAPLGTAAWMALPLARELRFRRGDFWLSCAPDGKPVGLRDDRHVLVCCGTRAGKGVSILVPNLAFWPGSAVVLDPKGENAMVTARRRGGGSRYCRGMGQKVVLLDPFDEVRTPGDGFADLKACFNPMDILAAGREESVSDAARIAEALIVLEDSKEPFFEQAARGLLKGIILHVATCGQYRPRDRHLGTVRRLLTEGEADLRELALLNSNDGKAPSGLALLFAGMTRNRAFDGVIAEIGAMAAHNLAESPRLLGSILQVAVTNTDFIADPRMKRCLTRSDFKLSDLKTDVKGMSLYLCLPQRHAEENFRWLRMMTTLMIGEMERQQGAPASGHPVLAVLDEFPSLRRMRVIENAAAQIAGHGVKLVFVTQTLAQLKDTYKDNWETLVANCGVKIFFGNDDHFTREYASKLVGECEVSRWAQSRSETNGRFKSWSQATTVGTSYGHTSSMNSGGSTGSGGVTTSMGAGQTLSVSTSYSTTGGKAFGFNESETHGHSESVQKRFLITPDEVGRLFGNRADPAALALISGHQPLYLRRIHYFSEAALAGTFDPHRSHAPPPELEALPAFHRQNTKARRDRRQRESIERLRAHARSLAYHLQAMREQEWRAKRRRQLREEKAAKEAYAFKVAVVGVGIFMILPFLFGP